MSTKVANAAARYLWLTSHEKDRLRAALDVPNEESIDDFIDRRMRSGVKLCYGCERELPSSSFYAIARGIASRCKDCMRAAMKASRNGNKKPRVVKGRTIIKRNEITAEMVRQLLAYDSTTGEFKRLRVPGRASPLGKLGSIDPKGYLRISINGRIVTAHRLAWLHYFGAWPKQTLNHKNGVKLDNRIENLEDVSIADNAKHAHRLGLIRLPGAKSTVKLTPQQALEIRASDETAAALVKKYGVSGATIQDIRAGRTWKNAAHLAAGGTVLSNGVKLPPVL